MAHALDQRLKAVGLELSAWPTLMCLWEQDGVTQTELSRTARVEAYTTTRVLDRLASAGLIERRPDPESRRVRRVHLTERGKSLEKELTPLAMAVNAQHLEPLSQADRTTLIRLLSVLVETAPR